MRIPTSPYIASDGAVSSLIGLAPRDKIRRSADPPTRIKPNATVSAEVSTLTIDAAASMGFGSMLDVNVSANTLFYLIDLRSMEEPVPGAEGSVIDFEHYGVAVRICVKAWGFKSGASTNIGIVSASATAGAASVTYQVDVIGIRTSDLLELPGLIAGSIGPFDLPTLQRVGAVFAELITFVHDHPERCRPELMAVDVDLKNLTLPYQEATSALFGLGRIAAGWSYPDAAAQIPILPEPLPSVDGGFVCELYESLVKSTFAPPNASQRDLARNILKIGDGK